MPTLLFWWLYPKIVGSFLAKLQVCIGESSSADFRCVVGNLVALIIREVLGQEVYGLEVHTT